MVILPAFWYFLFILMFRHYVIFIWKSRNIKEIFDIRRPYRHKDLGKWMEFESWTRPDYIDISLYPCNVKCVMEFSNIYLHLKPWRNHLIFFAKIRICISFTLTPHTAVYYLPKIKQREYKKQLVMYKVKILRWIICLRSFSQMMSVDIICRFFLIPHKKSKTSWKMKWANLSPHGKLNSKINRRFR